MGKTEGMEYIFDLAIVGGGIAGYTAALTAKNLLLDYVWLGQTAFGEKLSAAEKVTNFPAISGSGREFLAALEAQKNREEVLLTPCRIDGVYAAGEKFLLTAGERTFEARTVILATGVETKGQLKGEKDFLGRGVSYCAVCDGALYKGKKIAAVLSSPAFEEEAEYLASFADMVYAFCLYEHPKLQKENIRVCTDIPLKIEGDKRVERIVTGKETLSVDGVFFLKNSAPPRSLVGGLEADGAHVIVSRDLSTNIAGLFAAGDITGRPYQYAKAAGEGCVAAHSARSYLATLGK